MCIKNCDGSIYRPFGSLDQFDPDSPEHNLFNSFDQELMQISGTPIFYYELFIQKQTMDPLWREDRGKIWATNPIQLQGFYTPVASQNYMDMFGMDSLEEVQFQFNFRDVVKKLGHVPKLGSRLFTPHKRENWQIVQRNAGEFYLWGQTRLVIIAQKFQESTTTKEGAVSQPQPDFNLDGGSFLG